jgi:hypothetical protein
MSTAGTVQQTSELGQELKPREELTAKELLRDVGSVLRMSEAEVAAMAVEEIDPSSDQTMIINMGPQHPSTHGVLRLMLELQGETVLRCKPIVGYLHTGMEKTGETLIHAIETLHRLIETGELLKRREATGKGADVHVEEAPVPSQPIPVVLGVR